MKFDCGPMPLPLEARLEQKEKELKEGKPWFAWRPVRVADPDCRWLEKVHRYYPDAWTGCSRTLYKEGAKYRSIKNPPEDQQS